MKHKGKDWASILDLKTYYGKYVKNMTVHGDQIKGCCPLHQDGRASFTASLVKPVWTCFSKCGSGNLEQFHAKMHGMTVKQAIADLLKNKTDITDPEENDDVPTAANTKGIDPGEINQYHLALLKNKSILKEFQNKRGLTLATIKEYHLGFDGQRIWIPITDRGTIVNVKRHLFKGTGEKSLSYGLGTGSARLYPEGVVNSAQQIFITEGEFKALLMNQMGFPCITGTAGSKTWKDEWTDALVGKDVVIVFDIDEPGKEGAGRIARELLGKAKTLKIVDLPITEPSNADFPDYILRHGYTKKDFQKLVDATPEFKPKGKQEAIDLATPPVDVPLGCASNPEYYFKRVRISVTVSGKDLTPFYAPKKVCLGCDMDQGDKCVGCPLYMNKQDPGSLDVTFDPNSPDVLKLIRCNDEQQAKFIRKKLALPPCSAWTMKVAESWRVEELTMIPEITFSEQGNPYVRRTAYSVVPNEITSNMSYTMTGISVPDPETQHATLVITEAVPAKSSIEVFKMTPQIERELKVFQVGKGSVQSRIDDICKDLTNHVTQIWGRDDILTMGLLCFMSVLRFKFAGKMLDKGWVEGCVCGSTRTGKSETLNRLMHAIQHGERVSGENLSKTGLIGGLQSDANSHWHLTWGALPLNNGGLVFVDEAQGIPLEVMGDLSGIRSSGIAEVHKIVREKTESRTRIIWAANPRGESLSSYAYGIQAISELFGKPEDVARLDLAVTADQGEVDLDTINSVPPKLGRRQYPDSALSHLVLWAWSRKSDMVEFTPKATEECMAVAGRMAKKFAAAIPLAQPAEQRIKIARMAVACAALTFSTRDGERLIVLPEHVKWVEAFLDKAYCKPSMGYDLFSLQANRGVAFEEGDKEICKGQFVSFKSWPELHRILLQNPKGARLGDLCSGANMLIEEGKEFTHWAIAKDLLLSTGVGFKPTLKFTTILRELQHGNPPKPIPLSAGKAKI